MSPLLSPFANPSMLTLRFVIQVSVDTNTLSDTTADCLRFVTEFFEVISQSGPHIYHSALPLAPHSSIVRKLYGHQMSSPMTRIVTGVPTAWDSCVASAATTEKPLHAVWSPCGQFIACAFRNTIQVRDANTLEKVSVLGPSSKSVPRPFSISVLGSLPNPHGSTSPHIAFSPDGQMLACSFKRGFKLLVGLSLLLCLY